MLPLLLLSMFLLQGECGTLFRCDFDSNNLCGAQQASNDDFDWTIHQGATPSSNTGPSADSSGNERGYYIYMEASERDPGSTAVLRLELSTRPCGPVTLSFSYCMYGQHMGTLQVKELTPSPAVVFNRGKQRNSSTDDAWYRKTLKLSEYTELIEIVAIRGGESRGEPMGDIAVDDIIITDSCQPTPDPQPNPTTTTRKISTEAPEPSPTTQGRPSTAPPTTTSTTTVEITFPTITTTPEPVQVAADFQRGFDGFSQTSAGGANFILFRGATPSQPTGPRADHTYGNETGQYVLLEATDFMAGTTAALTSPALSCQPAGCCLEFWFHMYGQHVGTLNVSESIEDGDRTLFSRSQEQGSEWLLGRATLSADAENVTFMASRGGKNAQEPYGDIGLDDISVTYGPCAEPSTASPEPTTPAPTTPEPRIWGLDEQTWLIIVVVGACLLLVFLIIIIVQACALQRMRNAGSSQMADDRENFRHYEKYPSASNTASRPATTGGATSSTYIYAYDNDGYENKDNNNPRI